MLFFCHNHYCNSIYLHRHCTNYVSTRLASRADLGLGCSPGSDFFLQRRNLSRFSFPNRSRFPINTSLQLPFPNLSRSSFQNLSRFPISTSLSHLATATRQMGSATLSPCFNSKIKTISKFNSKLCCSLSSSWILIGENHALCCCVVACLGFFILHSG